MGERYLQPPGLESPAGAADAVTPNDSTDLATNSRAVYVGTGGHIKVTMISGDAVTFNNVLGGTFMPIRASRIWATGTTADDIIALY